MGKVSIGAALAASFRFVRTGWASAWGVLMMSTWVAAIFQAIRVLRPDFVALTLLGELVAVMITTAAAGALYRLVLQGHHPDDPAYAAHEAGLQWGRLEWRVLGANLIVGLILIVLFFIAAFIWGLALAASVGGHVSDLGNANSDDPTVRNAAMIHLFFGVGGAVTVLLLLPALAGLLYLVARLLVFAPLAADGGGFSFGKAWDLTRGAALPIVGALIVIGIVQAVVSGVGDGIAGLIGAAVGGGPPAARLWGGIAGAALGAAISTPLACGLQLYVYGVRGADPKVAEAFS